MTAMDDVINLIAAVIVSVLRVDPIGSARLTIVGGRIRV
jgi:hypothetical protein